MSGIAILAFALTWCNDAERARFIALPLVVVVVMVLAHCYAAGVWWGHA